MDISTEYKFNCTDNPETRKVSLYAPIPLLNIMPSISAVLGNDTPPGLTGTFFVICSILLVCYGPEYRIPNTI